LINDNFFSYLTKFFPTRHRLTCPFRTANHLYQVERPDASEFIFY